MSQSNLFTVAFKQFEGKNQVVENVSIDYFNQQNGFTDSDRERISKLTVRLAPYFHSYTRGAGVTEAPQLIQPDNSFKVIRTQ